MSCSVSPTDQNQIATDEIAKFKQNHLSVLTKVGQFWFSFANNHRKTYATFFTVLSAFSFATSFMFTKMCDDNLNGAEAALVRVVLMALVFGSYCTLKKYNAFDYDRKMVFLLFLRTLTSTFGGISGFSASQFISLPDHNAIQFVAVPITVILARIFLNEPFSMIFLIGIAASILGVVMVSRPDLFIPLSNDTLTNATSPTTSMASVGYICSVLTATCQAGTYIIVRKIMCAKKRLRNVEIIYNFSLFSIPPVFLSCILWRTIEKSRADIGPLDMIYIFCSGLFGLTAQLFMNMALKKYDASYISLIRGCDLIFSFIYQATIFNLTSNYITYIGIALMIFNIFVINIYKIWKKHQILKMRIEKENKNMEDMKSTGMKKI